MYFSVNIRVLRKRKKRTQEDVSRATSISRSTIAGYENNLTQPSLDALISISEYFKIPIDILLKTDLSKLSEHQFYQMENGTDVFLKGSQLRVLTTTIDSEGNENIELIPIKAQAGYTQGFANPEFISELAVFSLPFLSKEKKYRTFQIQGDSMLPICSGSWVTGEFVQDWTYIKNGEAFIILTLDEGIVFKIIENKLQSEQKLVLHSLNKNYKPYEMPMNEIKEIWKFTNYISSEMPMSNTEYSVLEIVNLVKKDIGEIKNRLGIQNQKDGDCLS